MDLNSFKEQIGFAVLCVEKAKVQNSVVKVLVHLPPMFKSKSVVLAVSEIGFNDKEGIIYIEAKE